MVIDAKFWQNKKVFITGHTGFKGGWLTLWLKRMGAMVYGYALEPPTKTNLYELAEIETCLEGCTIADIRNLQKLQLTIEQAQPDIVFHLAAQPLVRRSYQDPEETFSVNVMGIVNLLEAVRTVSSVKAVVNVTSDKCYENKEWLWPYRESDPMGGFDPYSCSKGCSELITNAYRRSFFSDSTVALASARAGNVIGGGDWADNRLIPDFLRAINSKRAIIIRYPDAIRPWQHVLEPLSGYLLLAEKLFKYGHAFSGAWNFGPTEKDIRSVKWIVEHLVKIIPNASFEIDDGVHPHEAGYLKLDSSKARILLGWQPRWSLDIALNKVVEWNEQWQQGENMQNYCYEQITSYCNAL